MQISSVGPMQNNSASFKAVNKEYLKRAEEDYKGYGTVGIHWMYELGDEVAFGDMTAQDARDTAMAARRFVPRDSMRVFEEFIKSFKV